MKVQEPEEEQVDMQMAPMIDIVFQLIIFFMCATTFQKYERDLRSNIPVMSEQVVQRKMEDVIVRIDKQGRVFVGNKEYQVVKYEIPELIALLSRLKKFFPDQSVIIEADKETHHQNVINVLNACAAANITNISFTE
ncbi:MAG: biopolymer transporter ExbD [Elusimicrobiota bacterium]|nr:biopolymer transporter ExbD [Endomicrobiia bacterium]MDW8165667.1 biopolymer transporter ExbD [Elusimicrobiota bacterium]